LLLITETLAQIMINFIRTASLQRIHR